MPIPIAELAYSDGVRFNTDLWPNSSLRHTARAPLSFVTADCLSASSMVDSNHLPSSSLMFDWSVDCSARLRICWALSAPASNAEESKSQVCLRPNSTACKIPTQCVIQRCETYQVQQVASISRPRSYTLFPDLIQTVRVRAHKA